MYLNGDAPLIEGKMKTPAAANGGGRRLTDLATVVEETNGGGDDENDVHVVDLTPDPPPAPWWSVFDCCRLPEEGPGNESRHSAFKYYSGDDVDVDVIIHTSSPPRSPPRAIIAPPVHTEGRPGVKFAETQYDSTDTIGGRVHRYGAGSPRHHHANKNVRSPNHEHGGRHHRAGSINSASQELIESLEADLCQCRKSNASKSRDVERLQNELGSVKKILAATVKEKYELSAERDTLRTQIEDRSATVESMQQGAELQREVEVLRGKLLDASIAKDKISADAEVKAANLQQALELAEEQLAEANEKNEFLTAELDDAQADASRAREDLASKVRLLESNLRQSKNESVANRLEAKGLRKELENARNSLDVTVSKADHLSAENKAMQQNISSLTLEMDAKASISSEADAQQKELETVRKSRDEAIAEKEELAVAYELLQKEVSSIAADRDRLLAERASPSPKAGANLSSSFEVEALQAELESMRRSLDEANAYKEQLSTFKDGMLKKINKLTKERDQLLAERESTQQQIDRVAETQVAAAGLVA
ncbi:hypothetical protein ACHAXT_010672 [Thalassiosira profunda]